MNSRIADRSANRDVDILISQRDSLKYILGTSISPSAFHPQFQARLPWYPAAEHGADMLPFPVKLIGEQVPPPSKAPEPGQHTDEVLGHVLGYDAEKIAKLRESGALG